MLGTENDACTLLPRIDKIAAIISCTPGITCICYSLSISLSVFSSCLSDLSSGDCLHGLINNVFLSQQSRMWTSSPN